MRFITSFKSEGTFLHFSLFIPPLLSLPSSIGKNAQFRFFVSFLFLFLFLPSCSLWGGGKTTPLSPSTQPDIWISWWWMYELYFLRALQKKPAAAEKKEDMQFIFVFDHTHPQDIEHMHTHTHTHTRTKSFTHWGGRQVVRVIVLRSWEWNLRRGVDQHYFSSRTVYGSFGGNEYTWGGKEGLQREREERESKKNTDYRVL